jgi:hypothetical protein
MTFQQVINEYLSFLWKAFQYDMDVFSQPWIYWTLLVPAMLYLTFFILKWIVITTPVWLPFSIIIGTFKGIKK